MHIVVEKQKVHTHKKSIRRDDLKGRIYFIQFDGRVCVTASSEHQAIVREVLGEPDSREFQHLSSYWCWNDVSAVKLVDILDKLATTGVKKRS